MKYSLVLKTNSGSVSNIMIGEALQSEFQSLLHKIKPTKTVFITDETMVKSLHTYCSPDNKSVFILNSGESEKNFDSLKRIIQFFFDQQIDKKSLVVAFGGGVVTDITGFAASIFYRGVSTLYVPTTLLAQVDAAIGGKNTINFNDTKNVLGTIRQPNHILIDINLLHSLPRRQINSGMAEIIKYGIGFAEELFSYIESLKKIDAKAFLHLVRRSAEIKVKVVAKDQDESGGERKLLNLGHTLGHAIEAQKNQKLAHGEAISIGIMFAAFISEDLGHIAKKDLERIRESLEKFALPTRAYFDVKIALENILHDKKKAGESIDFIAIKKIGHSYIQRLTLVELSAYLSQFSL